MLHVTPDGFATTLEAGRRGVQRFVPNPAFSRTERSRSRWQRTEGSRNPLLCNSSCAARTGSTHPPSIHGVLPPAARAAAALCPRRSSFAASWNSSSSRITSDHNGRYKPSTAIDSRKSRCRLGQNTRVENCCEHPGCLSTTRRG
ncbi:hypothetical protein Rhow_004683 [Rhodococcus wratislaviensis]|uniref:Uncharacterized protein n=1 Tax=Rhodococcus wratislaviensis TaxID=44752 RepID=A0A402CBL9_RHOWR|nr:hypothetical protein Rhow_004683 [Rhodococcus wratislaviensis]